MFSLPKNFLRAILLAFCSVATPALATTVIEFYNTNLDNYFITADANEAAAIDNGSAGPGWIRTGYTFESGGSTSVCRFYGSQSPGPNSHFYTVDSAECQGLKAQQIPTGDPRKLTEKSWNFESLDFVSTPPSNGTCPSGTVPVYRAYNNGFARGVDSNHRITSSLTAIQEVVARGWNNEGVVMCAPSGAAVSKWTYMVYMAGDNTLSDAAVADLKEMLAVGSNASVNVVVQAELNPTTKAGTWRGRIVKNMPDADWQAVGSATGGGVDMGNRQTLTSFIQWAKSIYPAENYALVLWSHGAGWKTHKLGKPLVRGALEDATSGTFMSLNDIVTGVSDAGVHFGLINFDACLMAMYEVAYATRNIADYLVASEEVEPGDGDDYTAILNALTAAPAMTSKTLSTTIVQTYRAFYAAQARTPVTKSVVDLSKIAAVKTAVENLAGVMTGGVASLRTGIQTAQGRTANYEYTYNRDLSDFATELKAGTSDATLATAAAAVETAVANAVVSNQIYAADSTLPINRSKGLAIYLPQKSETNASDLASYATLDSSLGTSTAQSEWAGFVNLLVTGDTASSYQPKATGNFAFKVIWDNPAVDLDLYVFEPTNLVAPYMGATTSNGFMSGDSSETGVQAEYYAAAATVQAGSYDIFVNYFAGSGSTTATLSYDDGSGAGFVSLGQFVLKNAAKPDAYFGAYPDNDFATYAAMLLNYYGDWYYGITHQAVLDPALRPLSSGKIPQLLSGKLLAQRIHLRAQRKSAASGISPKSALVR